MARRRRRRKKKGLSIRSVISTLIFLAALGCFCFSMFKILPYLKNEVETRNLRIKVEAPEVEDPETGEVVRSFDWDKLRKENPDVIGWIEIPGTKVDYPIVKCKTESEYLKKNFQGKYSILGSIFVQPEVGAELHDINTIIYGHNMKDKQMFGSLHYYEKEDFYKEYRDVILYTPTEVRYGTIYCVRNVKVDSDVYETEIPTQEAFDVWVQEQIKGNRYENDVIPQWGNQVLTLSTCTGGSHDYRFVVQAVFDGPVTGVTGTGEAAADETLPEESAMDEAAVEEEAQ